MRRSNRIISFIIVNLIFNCAIAQAEVYVDLTAEHAKIENSLVAIEFDLSNGTYSGIDKSDHTKVFADAWYRIGQGGWNEPEYLYKAERLGNVVDKFGEGEKSKCQTPEVPDTRSARHPKCQTPTEDPFSSCFDEEDG